ncbi:uncharacterized protein H6S33_002083 [Morchella sextelata]|uniref:uncharacterized protein n=1 Tax=Morchella sextelata TaxID=1174677 RepID=UPI001D050D32|nr:uncharacterized protein H6S33_002083 [Morchella sextelata]KAH0608031.1 hypothetical protein H6S33_002083 [Morchella sextelata]
MPRTTGTRPPGNRTRARNNPKNRSLNAFSIAQSTTTDRPSIPARRLGQAPSKKHKARKHESDDDDEEGAGRGRGGDDESVDGGSDSDGGHWKVGVDSDDESDIDSDEAMGESDEERFADFAFRGSSSTGRPKKAKGRKEVTLEESGDDDDEEEEEEDESEEDGEGFVDLSEMLDRATPSDSEPEDDEKAEKTARKPQQTKSKKRAAPESESEDDSDNGLDLEESMSEDGDDDEEEPSDGDDSDTDSFAHFSEEDDTPEDPAKLEALQSLITALPSGSKHAAKRVRLDDPNEGKTPNEYNLSIGTASQKLTLDDLMPTITDPKLKKSLKVLSDTAPAGTKSSGVQGKLSAPLAKRQQDRIDRAAAYVKTKETLGRWVDTVKMNREADHLHFPLPNAPNAPIQAPKRLLSITTATGRTPLTALEATISGILKESNMESEKRIAEFEELKTNKLSIEEVQKRTAELRMARELLYREELKAKRIKKIKSKAYHRVHKKERMRQEQAIEEALALEKGGVVGEEEMMERERKRAEERMTLRHKQSKWAKGMKESGRSVWDDEAQDGAIEMARRAEELTRRIKGKDIRGEGEEFGESSSEEEDDDAFDEEGVELRKKLIKDIEKAEASLGVSSSGAGSKLGGRLMGMKFMQNAEAAKKKENDAQLEELKNSLVDGDRLSDVGEDSEAEEEEPKQASGRMTFKPGKKEKPAASKATHKSEFEEQDLSDQEQDDEEDDEEDEEVTVVNKANAASTAAAKNPFTAPRTTAGTAGGKHLSFGASKDDDPTPAGGNPWLSQDAVPHVKPKQLTITSGKVESKTERSSKKLARDKKAALKNGDPAENVEVEIDTSVTLKLAPKTVANPDDGDDEEVDDKDISLIPAKGGKAARSQRALVKRAFAGDDVVMDFTNEKNAVVEEEGDQVVDESLPGWGSWTGEGLKPKNPDQPNRFLKTVKGIAKDKRKDAKLAKVIINEKRVKKNVKYHASALPHMFETKQQYERSLRVPIGPEWTTKATFQDSTMPRVMVKKGVVVEAISAPFK